MELGPVEYAMIVFPGNEFNGDVAPALQELTDNGTIRVIDLAFVSKDADGETFAMEASELAPDVQAVWRAAGIEPSGGLLNDDELRAAADGLEPNTSAALLVWEDLWAARFAAACRDSGGVLIERRTIPHELAQGAHDYAVSAGADALAESNS